MADTNLTPSAGNLNLSNKNPRITPLGGALIALGLAAATISSADSIRTPLRGTLATTGQTAALKQQGITTPGTGAITATGQTVAPSGSTIPSTGALTAAGVQGSIVETLVTLLTPPSGNMTLGLSDPLTPGTGAMAFTGSQPALASLRPSAGTLSLTGAQAIILAGAGSATITPGSGSAFFGEVTGVNTPGGSLSLVGGQPSLLVNAIRPVVAGSLAFTGTISNIGGRTRQPGTGTLAISGAMAAVSRSLIPSTGALDLSGQFPEITGFTQIVPDTGAVSLTGAAPTILVTQNVLVLPVTGALTLTGSPASLDRPLTPTTGALVIDGQVSSVSGQSATPDFGTIALNGELPEMRVDFFITPAKGALVATGIPSNINGLPPRGGVRFPRGTRQRSRVFVVPDREERT